MSYLQINNDGSATELGVIVGYQVQYKNGKRTMKSQQYNALWQALGFQKTLRFGSTSQIVPVYKKTTLPS